MKEQFEQIWRDAQLPSISVYLHTALCSYRRSIHDVAAYCILPPLQDRASLMQNVMVKDQDQTRVWTNPELLMPIIIKKGCFASSKLTLTSIQVHLCNTETSLTAAIYEVSIQTGVEVTVHKDQPAEGQMDAQLCRTK